MGGNGFCIQKYRLVSRHSCGVSHIVIHSYTTMIVDRRLLSLFLGAWSAAISACEWITSPSPVRVRHVTTTLEADSVAVHVVVTNTANRPLVLTADCAPLRIYAFRTAIQRNAFAGDDSTPCVIAAGTVIHLEPGQTRELSARIPVQELLDSVGPGRLFLAAQFSTDAGRWVVRSGAIDIGATN